MRKKKIKKKVTEQTQSSPQQTSSDEKCNHDYTIDDYDPDLVGTEFLFTWPREHVQPIQFHGMDIGPYEVRLTLRPSETVESLRLRAMKYLDAIAEREYTRKLDNFLKRIKTTQDIVKASKS
jgi:hypothetical protein